MGGGQRALAGVKAGARKVEGDVVVGDGDGSIAMPPPGKRPKRQYIPSWMSCAAKDAVL